MNEPLKRPCEHGNYDYHVTYYNTMGQVMEDCPGGREVTIGRYPRDTERYADLRRALGKGKLAPWEQDIERLLNIASAALGDSDE